MFGLNNFSTHYSRTIYNSLDFLGDVGGLLDALKLIAAALVALLNPSSLFSELTARLFHQHKGGSPEETNLQKVPALTYIDLLLIQISHKLCCCCGFQRRKKRLQEEGASRIERELDLVHFVRQ